MKKERRTATLFVFADDLRPCPDPVGGGMVLAASFHKRIAGRPSASRQSIGELTS
jgi:hypothetical protein